MSNIQNPMSQKSGDKPSEKALDNLNTDKQHPTYMVLDDINVDLATVFATAISVLAVVLFRYNIIKVALSFAAFVIPLRAFLPLGTTPEGTVLLTGASSGIGAELAYIFASKGHDLILVGRNDDQLKAVSSKCKTKTHIINMDLSLPGAGRKLYDQVKKDGFQVDVLVNDAGLGHGGDALEQTEEMTERMIQLNCTTLIVLTQLFAKDMVKRGKGWILEVSSIGGWMVVPGQLIYHASKHLVRAFSEGMAIELRGTGVHLTQLMPAPTKTQFVTRSHVEKLFIFSSSGSVEEPIVPAQAGYDGLCQSKRMVFSSYGGATMSTLFQLMPRSLHLVLNRLVNSPTPNTEMDMPKKNQRVD